MKQKKIGDILYVYSTTAYEITEDTDATVIKIQQECIPAYAALNESLVSKFEPINYKLFCVVKPEWADYMNDYTVTIDTITGGTVTASPTSGDEGEEITLTQEASTGYEFVSWDVEDGEGDPITVTDNKFLMPASNVTVGATFDKIDFDITVDNTIQNGSLSAPETANLGDTVTITATPASGYKLDTLTVMCGSLKITVVNNQFTMPAGDVTITGTFVQDAVPYEEQYFTIECLEDNSDVNIVDRSDILDWYTSVDNGETWVHCEDTGNSKSTIIENLNTGDKVLVKGNNRAFYGYSSGSDNVPLITVVTHGSGPTFFKVYGNSMSALWGDNFIGKTVTPSSGDSLGLGFRAMFANTRLVNASNLILPQEWGYFEYYDTSEFNSMFFNCGDLTAAPVLNFRLSQEKSNGAEHMFEGCTQLNKIELGPNYVYDEPFDEQQYTDFLNDAAATGTIEKYSADQEFPSYAVPSGWTVTVKS